MLRRFSLALKFAVYSILFSSLGFLVACSGGSGDAANGSSSITSPRAAVLQGSAIKGVIENGLVTVYSTEQRNGTVVRAEQALIEAVRTNSEGAYTIALPDHINSDVLILELSADVLTTMVCDVPAGCGVDDQNNPVLFGQEITLDDSFSLQGFVHNSLEGGVINAHLNPLTHLAVARAGSLQGGLSSSNLLQANAYIENIFKLESGALLGSSIDVTTLVGDQSASKAELELAIMSASFLSLVNAPDWDSVSEILEHLTSKLATGAQVSAVNMGALRDVALDDLFFNASEIAEDLGTEHASAAYSDLLVVVAEEAAEEYAELTTQAQQIAAVNILTQPHSETVIEGESVLLSVSAQGGGNLHFQWRKSGLAIQGATSSTLSIPITALEDSGQYDVVVSNSVGSVASLAALIVVNEQPSPQEPASSIALSWDIPTARENGADLELYEIQGYVIAYGNESGNLTNTVSVDGATITNIVLDDLASNTYYFSIATVDSDGLRGNYSNEITQSIM